MSKNKIKKKITPPSLPYRKHPTKFASPMAITARAAMMTITESNSSGD
jgi:hypothetical protein